MTDGGETDKEMQMFERIEEAITEHWGERCDPQLNDPDGECYCCEAWREFDALRQLEAEVERLQGVLKPLLQHIYPILESHWLSLLNCELETTPLIEAADAVLGVMPEAIPEQFRDRQAKQIQELEAEVERLREELTDYRKGAEAEAHAADFARVALHSAHDQLAYLWETTGSCPCGARKESPTTHPHVGGCPTGIAIRH